MLLQNASHGMYLNLYATLYDHYNHLMTTKAPTDIDGLVIRTISRDHYEQLFLSLLPIEIIADEIGLTKINDGYGIA